jgi:hypothetical protein
MWCFSSGPSPGQKKPQGPSGKKRIVDLLDVLENSSVLLSYQMHRNQEEIELKTVKAFTVGPHFV